MVSADLKWLLVKDQNSFLVKRDGAQFTREANNLTNLNTFKFSGLANDKTVGVAVGAEGNVEVSLKKTKKSKRVASAYTTIKLNKNKHFVAKKSVNGAKIAGLTQDAYYRRDLAKFALARYHALANGIKVAGGHGKKQKVRRSRK